MYFKKQKQGKMKVTHIVLLIASYCLIQRETIRVHLDQPCLFYHQQLFMLHLTYHLPFAELSLEILGIARGPSTCQACVPSN